MKEEINWIPVNKQLPNNYEQVRVKFSDEVETTSFMFPDKTCYRLES